MLSVLFKHWIAFCRCSRAIWIASERKANWMHCVSGAWKFAFLSDAIHMAREHRQNAIQYWYLYLFTTKFVAVLLTLTQKCHISQIRTKSKTLRTAITGRMTNWTKPQCDPVQILRTKDWHFKSLIIVNTAAFYFSTIYMSFTFEMDIGKGVLAIDIYNFIRA